VSLARYGKFVCREPPDLTRSLPISE
jgi:hypothetical protein